MSSDDSDEEDYLSAKDMRAWLKDEIANVLKESELRLKEAASFVTAYGMSELTPKEADERYLAYQERWGLPMMGLSSSDYADDDKLIEALDKGRENERSARNNRAQEHRDMENQLVRYQRLLGRPSRDPDARSR